MDTNDKHEMKSLVEQEKFCVEFKEKKRFFWTQSLNCCNTGRMRTASKFVVAVDATKTPAGLVWKGNVLSKMLQHWQNEDGEVNLLLQLQQKAK